MQCNEVIRELAAPSDDRDSAVLAEHLSGCAACSQWAQRASQLDRLWDATRAPDPTPQAWETVWARIALVIRQSSIDGLLGAGLPTPPAGRPQVSPLSTRQSQIDGSLALDSSTPIPVEHPLAPAASHNGSTPKAAPSAAQPSPSSRPHPWSFAAIASFRVAAAAAVLLVVSLVWQASPWSQNTQTANRPGPTLSATASSSVDAASLSIEIEEGNLVVIRSVGQKPEVLVLTSESSPFGIDDWLLMLNAMESIDLNPVVAMKD